MSKVILIAIVLFVAVSVQAQQSPIDGVDARSNPAEFAKQLGSTDPLLRQRSAEALARLAATDQRKLVEGYQLQEKNKEVRLALDWALYRMGKAAAGIADNAGWADPQYEIALDCADQLTTGHG